MTKKELLQKLTQVEAMATDTKLGRLIKRPSVYLYAIAMRDLFGVREKPVVCETFFDLPMHIVFPSAADIYITRGKSHSSEIRLAKFLIHQLSPGDTFLDVGAHYGYFSMLAAQLVGDEGAVHCFEAAPSTFSVLQKNVSKLNTIHAINQAASDSAGHLTFYEFPTMYSEYNSMDIVQYEGQDWFVKNPPTAVNIPSSPLDLYLEKNQLSPSVFKIDVEGAELKVLEGSQAYLKSHSPMVAMEYIASPDANSSHQQAYHFLKSLGYQAHAIDADGALVAVNDVAAYMMAQDLDSDNVVYVK